MNFAYLETDGINVDDSANITFIPYPTETKNTKSKKKYKTLQIYPGLR